MSSFDLPLLGSLPRRHIVARHDENLPAPVLRINTHDLGRYRRYKIEDGATSRQYEQTLRSKAPQEYPVAIRTRVMQIPEITLALFSIFNVLRLGSYLPQIVRVAADNEGAKAISYSTWILWIGANAS